MPNVVHVISRRGPAPAKDRTITFTLSTDLEDRAGDRIEQDGWKLTRYKANPVVLWGHNHSLPAIGRMAKIGKRDGALAGDVEFATAEQHPFADTVYRLTEGGFINAGSVGFIPLKYNLRKDGGIDWLEQELIEYSICNIPMNPDCLARAVATGIDIAPLADAAGAKAGSYTDLVSKLLASNPPAPEPSTPNLARYRARAANLALRVRI